MNLFQSQSRYVYIKRSYHHKARTLLDISSPQPHIRHIQMFPPLWHKWTNPNLCYLTSDIFLELRKNVARHPQWIQTKWQILSHDMVEIIWDIFTLLFMYFIIIMVYSIQGWCTESK